MMRFDNLNENEKEVLKTVEQLTALRTKELSLTYGEFETLLVTDQTYAYCRTYFDRIVIVAMNKGLDKETLTFVLPERFREIIPQSQFGSEAKISDGKLSVKLGAQSFDIYTVD